MRKNAHRLMSFFESKSWLVILGFFLTTIGGSILNIQIQKKSAENEHTYEIYKLRLSEAKSLQRELLEASNKRYFALHQVLARLAHPEDNSHESIMEYWKNNVTPAKDNWNKELFYYYAQARVLFSPTLSTMLFSREENKPFIHDPVSNHNVKRDYKNTMPKTLTGALMDVHATVYHLLFECSDKTKKVCDETIRQELTKLSFDQIEYLNLIQTCFAYRISSELLRYPYGPIEDINIKSPTECNKFS